MGDGIFHLGSPAAGWLACAFGAAFACFAGAASAQELQLETVIHAALDHGSRLQHADIALNQAVARLQEARGAFDWQLNGKAGWTLLFYPKAETINGVSVLTNSLANSSALEVSGGATKLFRNGISVQPGITYFPLVHATDAQTLGQTLPIPTINLQVPLLHAFDYHNAAAENERSASFGVSGAEFQRNAGLQQSALDAVQIYWRCLAAAEEESVLLQRQKSSQDYLASLRQLASAGQIDAAAVDREVARQTTLGADLARVREMSALCRADLASLTAMSGDFALPTIAQAFPNLDVIAERVAALNQSAVTQIAYAKRPDLQALQAYADGAVDKLQGAETGLDPKVNLLLNPTGVFVVLSRSLERTAEDGAVKEARSDLSEAKLKITDLQTQIAHDVLQDMTGLRYSLDELHALRQSAADLARIVNSARQGLASGSTDADQVRLLETQQSELDFRVVEAELDCVVNVASLRVATGTLEAQSPEDSAKAAVLFRSVEFH